MVSATYSAVEIKLVHPNFMVIASMFCVPSMPQSKGVIPLIALVASFILGCSERIPEPATGFSREKIVYPPPVSITPNSLRVELPSQRYDGEAVETYQLPSPLILILPATLEIDGALRHSGSTAPLQGFLHAETYRVPSDGKRLSTSNAMIVLGNGDGKYNLRLPAPVGDGKHHFEVRYQDTLDSPVIKLATGEVVVKKK